VTEPSDSDQDLQILKQAEKEVVTPEEAKKFKKKEEGSFSLE